MRNIPRWYVWQCVIWLFTGLPFQWFFTAFNGLSFFTLPDVPAPAAGGVVHWLLALVFLYHPAMTAPIAFWRAWSRRRDQA